MNDNDPLPAEAPPGPVVFGYDGSPASERALESAPPLLSAERLLVVTVWEPGVGLDVVPPGIPPAEIDIRAALQADESVYESAQRLAEHGAATLRRRGLEAEGLAVADVLTVADTLVRLARERHAGAIVVGIRGHHPVRELLVGSTALDIIRNAPCPVIVVSHEQAAAGGGAGTAR